MPLSYKEMFKWFVAALLVIAALGVFVCGCMWVAGTAPDEPTVQCGEYYKWKYDRGEVPANCYEKYKELS